MSKFCIFVQFKVKPGMSERFLAAAMDDATCSVRDEPACHQFDVMVPEDGTADSFCFYEVYDSPEAHLEHRKTPHYARFSKVAEEVVASRSPIRMFRKN